MTPRPARGEVWRFRDGSEGVVSSCNTMSTTVYVGPAAYMIPVGDVDLVFGHAARVDQATEASARAAAVADVFALGPAVFPPPAKAKHDTTLITYKDPANVTQAEHDAVVSAALAEVRQPATGTITIVAEPSRRGRKRKSDTEVK